MTEARLATSVLASALMRRAEAEGGFAAVLAKGDPNAGALLVILVERSGATRLLERVLRGEGRYAWEDVGLADAANSESLAGFLSKRRRFDPDIWLIELTIASAERFAAEMNESI